MKIFLIVLVLLLAIGGAMAGGYRIHPENLSFYLKSNASGTGQEQRVVFKDGNVLTGTLSEQAGDKIKIDVQGAALVFSKSELQSIAPVKSGNLLENWKHNYSKYSKLHPLITHSQEDTLGHKVDYMIMEPSRIADEMRKNHPEITGQAQVQAAMEQARAMQTQMRSRTEAQMREMEAQN